MALVIEDGSGVAGAVSYISVTDAREYALPRGLSLPADDTSCEIALVKACDFLETFRAQYAGDKTSADQPLQWPRAGAQLDGLDLATDTIPAVLLHAQVRLAVEIAAGTDLQPTSDGREVRSVRAEGAVTVEWACYGNTNAQPVVTAALALLQPLFGDSGTTPMVAERA